MGSGAFGRVVRADAVGLKKEEPVTTVAVKMIRSHQQLKATNGVIEALINWFIKNSCLPRRTCERCQSARCLHVIVESCRFGNLCTFLRQQRTNFVNLVNASNGALMRPDFNSVAQDSNTSQLTENEEANIITDYAVDNVRI